MNIVERSGDFQREFRSVGPRWLLRERAVLRPLVQSKVSIGTCIATIGSDGCFAEHIKDDGVVRLNKVV